MVIRVQIVFPNLISKFANQFSKWLAKAKIWLAENPHIQLCVKIYDTYSVNIIQSLGPTYILTW